MAANNPPRTVPARSNLVIFDDLRRYFGMKPASRARRPVPRVRCYICQDQTSEIAHPALATLTTANANDPNAAASSSSSEETEPPNSQTGVVLPCGHMFHASCWEPYPATAGFPLLLPHGNSPPLLCPHCRISLVFTTFPEFCVETAHIYDIPETSIPHVRTHIPQTVGEWRKEYLARRSSRRHIPVDEQGNGLPDAEEEQEEEEEEERWTLGRFCNGCRLDRAEGMANCIADIREMTPWDCARERVTGTLAATYFDDEIDLAYPGWEASGGDVNAVRGEPGWQEEMDFVVGNLRKVLRKEGNTWKGEKPGPESQAAGGGG
ncbi:hypothetical protein QBC40DRAFT_325274 [Triangularia verruculosa]|uniref:RING-type domain-containing protein n=1 Tax=Triangularia verruculosa TaxID=2587418 RepID=A0AAN6XI36_9PEZI|nr:hypothetical protein QBC40DRAFT_325274 [Triangularia verruculosa]